MKKVLLAGLAFSAISAGAFGWAQAQGRSEGPMAGMGPMGGMDARPTFQDLDTDGDGSITIAEMKARSAARFAESDTDGDGKLTADELTAAMAARAAERAATAMARMIEWRDTDGDGALSQAEMSGDLGPRIFMNLDADDDGKISAEEFSAMQGRARMGPSDEGGYGRGENRGWDDEHESGDHMPHGWRLFGNRG